MARKNQSDPIAFRPKSENVQNILGSIKAKFLDRYPRVERARTLVEVSKEEAAYYPTPQGYQPFRLETPPVAGYVEICRLRLNDFIATNELLCYQILKHTYGPPDIAAALLDAKKEKCVRYDWSYCLRIHEAALVEVRRISHSIFFVAWGVEGSAQGLMEQAAKAYQRFVDDISETLRQGKILFQSESERGRSRSVGVPNPYVEKYAAALELMRLAKNTDKPRDWKRFRWGESIDHPLTGSVYLSAILFFYVSLEAFEQLVREYLLKADRRTKKGRNEIKRRPLKERIARLDEFCDGFRHSPMPKGGQLYNKFGILSRVRNEVLHGNIPKDVNIYGLSEDGFVFIYNPEGDDEDKVDSRNYVPFFRGFVRRRHAEYVKGLVDEIISSIIDSLTEDYVEIGRGFRRNDMLRKDPDGGIRLPPKLL